MLIYYTGVGVYPLLLSVTSQGLVLLYGQPKCQNFSSVISMLKHYLMKQTNLKRVIKSYRYNFDTELPKALQANDLKHETYFFF